MSHWAQVFEVHLLIKDTFVEELLCNIPYKVLEIWKNKSESLFQPAHSLVQRDGWTLTITNGGGRGGYVRIKPRGFMGILKGHQSEGRVIGSVLGKVPESVATWSGTFNLTRRREEWCSSLGSRVCTAAPCCFFLPLIQNPSLLTLPINSSGTV